MPSKREIRERKRKLERREVAAAKKAAKEAALQAATASQSPEPGKLQSSPHATLATHLPPAVAQAQTRHRPQHMALSTQWPRRPFLPTFVVC